MNKIARARQCLAFLEVKSLDSIDFNLTVRSWGLRLEVNAENITEENLRALKRHFGPLKIASGYGYKNLEGAAKLDDETRLELQINRAYNCEKLDPVELTEQKWDEIKEKIRDGLISIEDCKPSDSLNI